MSVDVMIEEACATAADEATGPPVSTLMPSSEPDLNVAIAERAYFLWERSGWAPGHDMEFWLTAENELFGSGDGPTA